MHKTFNIYSDESCHLEHDGKEYMVIGYVSSAYNQVKRHAERINNLKEKHHFYAEIKWSKVSDSQHQFYRELINYFFDTDLKFRAIVVNKCKIDTEKHGGDFDTFYYKMYYQLLNHNLNSQYSYNVYLDIKDTLSNRKVNKLKEILNIKYGVFNKVQHIRSHETVLLQLADVLIGAISYNLNDEEKKSTAKVELIERIKQHSKQSLDKSSFMKEEKMNLFFIELK